MEYERGSRLNKMLHLGQNKHSVAPNSTYKKKLNIEKGEGMRIKTSPAVPRKKNGVKNKLKNEVDIVSVTGYAAPRSREYPLVTTNNADSTVDGYFPTTTDNAMARTPLAAPMSK